MGEVATQLSACEEFYGLRTRPFSLTPDLRFTYHSHSHTHALEQITRALQRREGIVVVTGEVGTGKTMLCRALLDTFEARTFLSVILDPMLTVEDLLQQVLEDFGLITKGAQPFPRTPLTDAARHAMVATLQKFLASLASLGAHAVIMIDEAQHLNAKVLEQVRLLSNFETDSSKLLQIVLVGQPNLEILLSRPDMRQLDQRVARRCRLEPLTDTEVQDYVERRLEVASQAESGASMPSPAPSGDEQTQVRFSPAAIRAVAAISKGIPRLVNTLCDRALEAGYDARARTIERGAVLAAAQGLGLPIPAGERVSGISMRRATAAVLALLVAAGAFWSWSRQSREAAAAGPHPLGQPVAAAPPPATSAPQPENTSPAVASAPVTGTATSAPPATGSATPVPPPAAPAATPGPPTPAGTTLYDINAAAFRTEERATEVADGLLDDGIPATTRVDPTGTWYRVVVGPFASAEEARDVQENLERRGFSGTRISPR